MSDPDEKKRADAGLSAEEREALLADELPALHAYVRLQLGARLKARESSHDLVQSVCREILLHGEGRTDLDRDGFRKWLFIEVGRKIADRHAYFHREKRDIDREVTPADGQSADLGLVGAYGAFITPSRHAMAREEIARVEEAFAVLDDDEREAILCARMLGLSHAETALRLGVTEAQSRKILFRALRRLTMVLDQ
jgi:RNA polymerase sigma factor (sigma-70 family)